jgi:hypothetical protein
MPGPECILDVRSGERAIVVYAEAGEEVQQEK